MVVSIFGGNTTKETEVKVLDNGQSLAKTTIAINQKRGDKDETIFVNIVAYEPGVVTFLGEHVKKGTGIAVSGRLTTGEYTDKAGHKCYTVDVIAESVDFSTAPINQVTLIGRLTKDPEVRYTASTSTAVGRYSLAIDRKISKAKKDAGAKAADFYNIICFNKAGEFAGKYFKKGMKVAVTGRLNRGTYDRQDGTKAEYYELITFDQQFAEPKNSSEENKTEAAEVAPAADASKPVPAPAPEEDGFMAIPDGIDEELPFR